MANEAREPIKAPPKFTDKLGITWTIDPTLGVIDTVFANTQVDLLPEDNDPSVITSLLFNQRKLASVLWEFCQKQAEAKAIDPAAFRNGLDGKAITAGWGALVDGIYFFIQSQSPKVADQWMQLVEAQMKIVEKGAERLSKTVSSKATEAALEKAMEDIEGTLQEQITEQLGNYATNSRQSPASIRERIRSGS